MNTFPISKKIGFLSGPLLCILILVIPFDIIDPAIDRVIAIAAWMIVWWITEAVSISVTALIPLALFPLLGIGDIKSVASNYANPIVYLFFGGFVIALALEKVQLHKRIALSILKITGTKANGIVLGFMIATALMSMWISNTASTVVMLPIAVSVIQLLMDDADGFTKNDKNFALSIMLGIAFAANIGGMSTLIGTPPNSVMLAFLNDSYNIDIGFFQWMKMGVPFAILMLTITYFCITRIFFPNRLGNIGGSGAIIQTELNKLGKMSRGEKIVLIIFLCTAIAWMLRSYLNTLLPNITLTDTTISVIAALAMFIIPLDLKKGEFPLDWKDTSRLPWGILILFGGGLALASGLKDAGFIAMIGDYISGQTDWSMWVVTAVLIFLMLFMTELMSNVALVTILIPLVVGIALGMDVPILQMVIPVTLASSCAFMLPMATPPNAIVFASGHVRVSQMARIGIVLNLISVGLLFAIAYWIVPLLF
ncbi:di- and tricarboxylate transporter [Dokdonia pacifica]|uniref:Solute carrier family 13 (Sodium-dependent dicarboxylate transporter), member 2/3/5 n=1 Tax=Dokdonia pacifica TaxID=1627892 RepID=A0A238WSV5_9FLAO|nr:DASS family sodium-coupled anion symporter [Dokdonia pacifica]GGG23806.1 di- and tricarboxylate transporter [Dokdonia pacifica]SNR49433.1 solute carrier family 13 (sodium-dependent dicarboxylate transporter), member 2/3/5 [Dokdonia pacifica]